MAYLNPENQDSVPVIDSVWKSQRTAGLSCIQVKSIQRTDLSTELLLHY